jgi:DNA polymerase-1
VLWPAGKGETEPIGPAEVRKRYGIRPDQVPDFIALRGDPSDKLPGARGVGPKTAAQILAEYDSLEEALAAGRFSAEAEALRLYRQIAQLDHSAPLPPLDDTDPDWAAAAMFSGKLGLGALAGRLEERDASSKS